jgi:hypothetical protein
MEFTDPLDVPVVDAAHRPEAEGPKRTSLPSMLPPAWSAVAVWSTANRSSSGLPLASKPMAAKHMTSQMAAMMANTARPCRRSLTMWP